ncbi:hypothetical protein CIG19_03740 [Enterobacterales bacterium CwR94]|nr:hypothetical protein CIG19_03740 [Enterobacterales bacterium CwR94]
MNEITSGATNLLSMGLSGILVLIGLVIWFFVNRASTRANQQILLLEALLEEQKRQNKTLRRLTDHLIGKDQPVEEEQNERDFTRLIPER